MKNREKSISESFFIYYDCLTVVPISKMKFVVRSQ